MKRLSFAIFVFGMIFSSFATTVGEANFDIDITIGSPTEFQEHFTEHFSSSDDPFDLSNKAILFTPTADGTSYTACLQEITELPTDPTGGTGLEMDDDGYAFVDLYNQERVSIFGSTFPSFYVGSNGYITFAEGDTQYWESLAHHFATWRISGLFHDLDPSSGGEVSWKQLAGRVAVTWHGVPEYDTDNSNTFQVEMYFDGRLRLAWLGVAADTGIIGLSDGLGLPPDFQETDLSTYELCSDGPGIIHAISGRVRTTVGAGISNVVLVFSNNGGSTITDSNGYYTNMVVDGWSGVATPSKSGYIFDPPFISYDNVSSDILGQNYTGSLEFTADYLTEHFSSGDDFFDLSNKAILFTPAADGTSYTACLQEITELPTDSDRSIQLELDDDDYQLVNLDEQKTVSIYGSTFPSFYVGSNGYITFAEGDTQYWESLAHHFATWRICGLFHDLDPSSGGEVSWKQLTNRAVVTWEYIPEYDTGGSNTFQIEMYFDGRIRLAWLGVATNKGIVGLSDGLGLPPDFQETDLSAYLPCADGPGVPLTISGHVRDSGGSGIADVLLTFSNDGGSTTTDSTGYYSNSVWYSWSGTVVPSKSGYVFDPRSRSYSSLTSDMSNQDYTSMTGLPPDYFSEWFFFGEGPFDLSNKSILFIPTIDGTSYSACLQEITQLPTHPVGGIDLQLEDDSYAFIQLSDQQTVSIFGNAWPSFYVGSNGYITFTEGDTDYRESLADHFDTPRISILFHDFSPSVAGSVSWKQLADRVAVTWLDVPEFLTDNSSTFQVEMYFDGRIRLAWLDVAAQRGVVGLSDGLTLPADLQETDLSAYPPCEDGPQMPPIISGYVRTAGGSAISDVVLTFSNNGGSTATDSTGYYTNAVVDGWSGAATPSKSGYTFEPPSISYNNVTSDISGQNYVGIMESVPTYFTEQFSSDTNPFDLLNKSIMFTPTADSNSYTACVEGITQLPTNPVGGIDLELGDDDFQSVSLDGQKTVVIYGNALPEFYVGSNGYITFINGDRQYRDLLENHFDALRISILFRDLNPFSKGLVSCKQLEDRVAVTWQDVPEYDTDNSNTFQVEMYFDGRIRLAWLAIAANTGIVGLSDGLGLPADFQQTDLSAYPLCGTAPPAMTPIAHWTMDDNAANTTVVDSSDQANHGTAQRNTSVLTIAGRINGALAFNGTSDYISVPDKADWTFAGDFTITLWVKFDTFNLRWWESAFMGHDEGPYETNKWIFSYDPADNRTLFHINSPSIGGLIIKGNPWIAQTGIWYFLAITRSGSTYTFYRDGAPDGSATDQTVIADATAPLTIGWAEGARTFDGALDDIRIYNRALSGAEIAELYNQ